MNKLVLCLLISLLRPSPVELCIGKVKVGPDSIDDEDVAKRYNRRVTTECKCGADHDTKRKPWNLYVVINNGDDQLSSSTCIGTLIAPNLIAVSHKCLITKSKKLDIFDLWGEGDVVEVDDIVDIRNHLDEFRATVRQVNVKKIILNSRYVKSADQGRFPRNDMALLFTEDSIMIHSIFSDDDCDDNFNCTIRPICIPTFEEAEKLLYREAYYYGISGSSFNPNPKVRLMDDNLILPGSDCDRGLNNAMVAEKNTVCLKLKPPAPENEGGPLIVNSDDEGRTAFLAGMASWTGGKKYFRPGATRYTYFSHIRGLIRFIEREAHFHDTVWCEAPPLNSPFVNPPVNL